MYVVLQCGLKIQNTKLSRGKVASYYWLFFSFLIYVSYSAPILGHTACACCWSTGEDHAGAHVRGDWRSWCSISQQRHTLSLKEGRQSHFTGTGLSIQLTFTQQWRETSHSASHGLIAPQSFWSPVSTDQTATTPAPDDHNIHMWTAPKCHNICDRETLLVPWRQGWHWTSAWMPLDVGRQSAQSASLQHLWLSPRPVDLYWARRTTTAELATLLPQLALDWIWSTTT